MPPRNYLTGSAVAEFRPDDGGDPIALHPYIQTVTDTIRPRLAVHEFLKVDGAEVEFMGVAPGRYRFALVFVDSDSQTVAGEFRARFDGFAATFGGGRTDPTAGEWRARYNDLVARIERWPIGTLVHPALGERRVACEGIDGAAIDINQAINAIQVPIGFVDAQVDTQRAPIGLPSVGTRTSAVLDAISSFRTKAAPFLGAATQVAALATSAAALATAAQNASEDVEEGPVLATLLGTVADDTNAAIDAIEDDDANEAAADAVDAVTAAEVVYAACVEANEAVEQSRPPLIEYTVGSDTNILALAALLYGRDAQSRIDEMRALNPSVNVYAIPAGAVLRLSTPTLV